MSKNRIFPENSVLIVDRDAAKRYIDELKRDWNLGFADDVRKVLDYKGPIQLRYKMRLVPRWNSNCDTVNNSTVVKVSGPISRSLPSVIFKLAPVLGKEDKC